jgi:DNA-binding response OmpR family regulator
MMFDESKIVEVLSKCSVLILEDDIELCDRIKNLLGKYTQKIPLVAHSVEQAKSITLSNDEKFDLVILDIMLPETIEQNEEIYTLEESLKKIHKSVRNLKKQSSEDAKNSLFTLRYERSIIIKQIEDLINVSAGISLVELWRQNNLHFPILFLTAVGDDGTIEKASSIAGENSDWIIKPSTSENILYKCVELLLKWNS